MTEPTARYEMTLMPKLTVKVDAQGNVIGADMFINDAVVNCYDQVTGTFHNWTSEEMWEELGEEFHDRVVTCLQKFVLYENNPI